MISILKTKNVNSRITGKPTVAVVGNNYGYNEILPVLASIEGVNTIFALPREFRPDQKKLIDNSEVKTADLSDILVDEKIKIVFIAVPPTSQFFLGKTVLEHKKHLYCEKPAGLNLNQAIELRKISKQEEKHLFIGFQFRFDPGLLFLRDLISSGNLGEISEIEVNWHTIGSSGVNKQLNWRNSINLGGGVHRDFLCHVVDYLRWIANDLFISSLESLTLDTKFMSDIKKICLISDKSDHPAIKINISRGMLTESFWEIMVKSNLGELTVTSRYPFSISSYTVKHRGNNEFSKKVESFLQKNNFLVNKSNSESARSQALKLYFEQIVDNISRNGVNVLPSIEDALFTQKISDNVQELLLR